jgi:ankyrin repeat protein
VLQLVRQQGVDVNAACDPEGRSALHAAAERGQHSCCSALLELGADSYQYDDKQVSALMLAAKNGHDQVLKVCSDLASPYACRFLQACQQQLWLVCRECKLTLECGFDSWGRNVLHPTTKK